MSYISMLNEGWVITLIVWNCLRQTNKTNSCVPLHVVNCKVIQGSGCLTWTAKATTIKMHV